MKQPVNVLNDFARKMHRGNFDYEIQLSFWLF